MDVASFRCRAKTGISSSLLRYLEVARGLYTVRLGGHRARVGASLEVQPKTGDPVGKSVAAGRELYLPSDITFIELYKDCMCCQRWTQSGFSILKTKILRQKWINCAANDDSQWMFYIKH